MAEIGALGERTHRPGVAATIEQEGLELGRRERRVSKCCDHARRAVAILAEMGRLLLLNGRSPRCAEIAAPGMLAERARHRIDDTRTLAFREPVPTAHERKHIPGVAMHRTEEFQVLAVEILLPDRPVRRILKVPEQPLGLSLEDLAPAV